MFRIKLFLIVLILFVGKLYGQISITQFGLAYAENFNSLSNTAGSTTNNLSIAGWLMNETGGGARDNEQYGVETGGSTTGDTYSYGTTASSDRALGSLQSGTLIANFGVAYTNNTGRAITSLDIAYTGEQWRISNTAASRDDKLLFQYSLDATSLTTGTWTSVSAGDFTNPIKTNATAIALDGNSAINRTAISFTISSLNIANGANFLIRWVDMNASGADDGLAVDDFSLSVTPAPINLSIADISQTESNSGTTTFSFTVNLSNPANFGGVNFDITTANNTASSASDYVSNSLTSQTIAAGSSSFNFDVTVNGDIICETDESFFVNISNVTGTSVTVTDNQAIGAITNDETTPVDPTVTPSSRCDAGTVDLEASSPSGTYDWYDASSAGTFQGSGSPFTTSNISATTDYWVETVIDFCRSNRIQVTATINPTLTASVTIDSDDTDDTFCAGTNVIFTATPTNEGTTPIYQWKIGSTNVGTDSPTFSTTALTNGDVVTVEMTSNASPCLAGSPATSNGITNTVNPTLTASVTIDSDDTDDTFCAGTNVTFTATPTNEGTTPIYQWKIGSTNVGTDSPTFSTTALTNGDVVTVEMTSNASPCLAGSPATSNGITNTVNAIPSVNSTLGAIRCFSGTVDLSASASVGTLNWYDASSAGTLVGTGTNITSPVVAVTTSYWVDATASGCTSARTEVIATVEACSKIVDAQCGATLNASNTKVYCNNVTALSGTTNYHFRIVSAAGTQYYTSTNRWFTFDDITYTYGTPYTIDVQVDRNGGTSWGVYGASCVVNSPNTKIETGQCGSNITSISTKVYANDVPNATRYRFMFKEAGTGLTLYVTTSNRWFTLSQFAYKFNTYYSVYVSSELSGVFSGYGSPCTIYTPKVELVASQCNTLINSKNTQILCNSISGATTYRFRVETGGSPIYIDKAVRFFTLNDFTYALNTTYNVSVCVQINGAGPFSPYGNVCTITTPGTTAIMQADQSYVAISDNELFSIETYPNPNNGEFTISSTHEGTFNLVNELGQLIQTIEIKKENNYQAKVGSQQNGAALSMSKGIYFVTGIVHDNVITKKVIVQ